MNYKVTAVKDGYNEHKTDGQKLFENEKGLFCAWMRNGKPDPREWKTVLPYWPFEPDMPIFTREYCEYQGVTRKSYDTITIID